MNTIVISKEQIEQEVVRSLISEVVAALIDRGYNVPAQLSGYIISGDPAYITAHKDARNKIQSMDRYMILETILKDYMDKNIKENK